MLLHLSKDTPWNANYCTEDGQVIYKVESTTPSIGARHTKIFRIVAPKLDPTVETVDDTAFRDSFETVGEVNHHVIRTSRIKYNGKDESTATFLRKGSWGLSRIFTGSDGVEYEWRLASRVPTLYVDGTETQVAAFHPNKVGNLKEPKNGSLEIFPAGQHMMDLIMVTFIYVENYRAMSVGSL
ncbi:hypothetical protein CPB83DRAFT_894545 [Crepidotus variabilis]|uniref:DUF6593 domain-containing protein n=1 Tax=Crepidotus variabilis TaxID=179855 RepID=A0A9P6EG53_9AGAR|nr:hypothetical protein CPB83DRAFT_894545 [Crepidotus variabilis]